MMTIARYCIFAFALGLYALVFAEGFMRLFAPQAFVPREIAPAPYGVRMNEPGARYEQRTPETSVSVRINSQGLRADQDYARPKPAGVRRVAMFGDSYFLGYEADLEDVAATKIEASLRRASCPVEVLNFAVSGFGTAEMLKTLEAAGLAYEPDVVLFAWHHTDPDDNRRSGLYRLSGAGLEETGATYVPAMGLRARVEKSAVYRAIAENSHLFIAARERGSRYVRRAMAGRVFDRNTTGVAAKDDGEGARPLDLALLQRAEAVAQHEGARFFVVDVPGMQTRMRFNSSFRLLPDSYVEKPNYLSPLDAFNAAAAPTEKLYWERGHRHLTPRGNAVLAEFVAEKLLADPAAAAALACADDALAPKLAARAP